MKGLPGSDSFIGKAAPPAPKKDPPKPELLHAKLMEMTTRAHKNEKLVFEFIKEREVLDKVLVRALASLDELHCKTGMIEFWGESDEMPKFIHHPVVHAKSDISHVLSRLREWKEKMAV